MFIMLFWILVPSFMLLTHSEQFLHQSHRLLGFFFQCSIRGFKGMSRDPNFGRDYFLFGSRALPWPRKKQGERNRQLKALRGKRGLLFMLWRIDKLEKFPLSLKIWRWSTPCPRKIKQFKLYNGYYFKHFYF